MGSSFRTRWNLLFTTPDAGLRYPSRNADANLRTTHRLTRSRGVGHSAGWHLDIRPSRQNPFTAWRDRCANLSNRGRNGNLHWLQWRRRPCLAGLSLSYTLTRQFWGP